MLAYLFWHVPFTDVDACDHEAALLGFHGHLASAPPQGLEGSAAYRISEVPWLNDRPGYEDWCFVTTSAVLDNLNKAAIKPERWDAHAAISSKTDFGHGGLYYHLHGAEMPVDASQVAWLKRPRGIRYEDPLQDIIARSTGFLSCWRKLMVLGPAHEFAIVGDASLNVVVPRGWQALVVKRTRLTPR